MSLKPQNIDVKENLNDERSETTNYGASIDHVKEVKLIDKGNYYLIPSKLDPNKDKNVIRIVTISDTHNAHNQLINMPKADILIHAGDFTNVGKLKDIQSYDKWINDLINVKKRYKYSILVAGNHDITLEKEYYNKSGYIRFHGGKKQDTLKCNTLIRNNRNIIYLQDTTIKLFGITFYGSPYQPEFYDWAFNLKRGKPLQKVWSNIPDHGVDVLISHGPPKYHGDKTSSGRYDGCHDLLKRVLKIKTIQYHVFGHIHGGYGVTQNKNIETIFINAAILNSQYQLTNKPIMFYIAGNRDAEEQKNVNEECKSNAFLDFINKQLNSQMMDEIWNKLGTVNVEFIQSDKEFINAIVLIVKLFNRHSETNKINTARLGDNDATNMAQWTISNFKLQRGKELKKLKVNKDEFTNNLSGWISQYIKLKQATL